MGDTRITGEAGETAFPGSSDVNRPRPPAWRGPSYVSRLKTTGFHLLILGAILAALYFASHIIFDPLLIVILAGAIVLPLAFPHWCEDLVSALSWLGIAAVAWFHYGEELLAVVAGVIGVITLIPAISNLRR